MNLYRSKKDGQLDLLYRVSPRMFTGHWYEAVPYFPNQGTHLLKAKFDDFYIIANKGE